MMAPELSGGSLAIELRYLDDDGFEVQVRENSRVTALAIRGTNFILCQRSFRAHY